MAKRPTTKAPLDVSHELPSGDEMMLPSGIPLVSKLPKIGSKQLIFLACVVVILAIVGLFFMGEMQKNQTPRIIEDPREKVLAMVKDVSASPREQDNDDFRRILGSSMKIKNYERALSLLKDACPYVSHNGGDSSKLKEAYDFVLSKVDKSKINGSSKEASQSPYIWYCP